MQFDSVHIVSGGVDNTVCITDIATGEKIQTLNGHGVGHILGLAFDTERIISIGSDNTMRYWQWGDRSFAQDKFHLLDKGETLLAISKQYSVPIESLMKWNGITDMKQCHTGMKLIVRKGDPTQPTEAEKFALKQISKQESNTAKTARKIKQIYLSDTGKESFAKFDRVHKLATDIDFFSMGNRMFRKEKQQLELFPDKFDPNFDPFSLANRMHHFNNPDHSTPGEAAGSRQKMRYFISEHNMEEWKAAADEIALTMLSMLVEYEAYEVVLEQKRELRSSISLVGRIHQFEKRKSSNSFDGAAIAEEKQTEDANGSSEGESEVEGQGQGEDGKKVPNEVRRKKKKKNNHKHKLPSISEV
jgi:hypothetical protein